MSRFVGVLPPPSAIFVCVMWLKKERGVLGIVLFPPLTGEIFDISVAYPPHTGETRDYCITYIFQDGGSHGISSFLFLFSLSWFSLQHLCSLLSVLSFFPGGCYGSSEENYQDTGPGKREWVWIRLWRLWTRYSTKITLQYKIWLLWLTLGCFISVVIAENMSGAAMYELVSESEGYRYYTGLCQYRNDRWWSHQERTIITWQSRNQIFPCQTYNMLIKRSNK